MNKILNSAKDAVRNDVYNTYDAFDKENYYVTTKINRGSIKIYHIDGQYVIVYSINVEINDKDESDWYTRELTANMLTLLYKDEVWKVSHSIVYNIEQCNLFNVLLGITKTQLMHNFDIEKYYTKDVVISNDDARDVIRRYHWF